MASLLPRLFTTRNVLYLGSLILKGCIFLPLPLLCQSRAVLSANVPFSFSTGTHEMPAGDYTLYRTSDHIYSLCSRNGSDAQTFTVFNASGAKTMDDSRLTFHHYGNRYFLASLWFQGARDGLQIQAGKTEKELAAAAPSSATPDVLVAFGTVSSQKQ